MRSEIGRGLRPPRWNSNFTCAVEPLVCPIELTSEQMSRVFREVERRIPRSEARERGARKHGGFSWKRGLDLG